MKTLSLAIIASFTLAANASAQFKNPFKNTPVDPGTWKNPGIKVPNPFRPRPDSGSGLSVISPPYIAANGNIYSGTSNTAQSARYVGKARLTYRGRQAWWTTNYRDNYGRPSDRRAPRYDRKVNTNNTGGSIQIGQTMRITYRINPSNGWVAREVWVGNQRRSSKFAGFATKKFSSSGRPYYSYKGKMVWAN